MSFKKIFLLGLVLFGLSASLFAQALISNPRNSLILSMEGKDGVRGASVTYDPAKKMYYACFAGNAYFTIETFDNTGKHLALREVGSDMRGIWYNPKTRQLEGNCFDKGGLVHLGTYASGFVDGKNERIRKESLQPDPNTVGDLDTKKKCIIYLKGNEVQLVHRKKGVLKKTIELQIPVKLSSINSTSVVYTGKKKMEYAVFNYVDNKIYLFNSKTGELTGTVNLPTDAPYHDRFNFSFANNHIMIYNIAARKWMGYMIF